MTWVAENAWMVAFVAVAVGVGFAINIVRMRARRRKTYQELLEPELKGFGFNFVSSTTPKLFDRGPFPKFEIEIGRPTLKTPIGSGGYDEYRIVRFRDPRGVEHEAWARLKFALFRIWKIDWVPALSGFGGKGVEGSASDPG